MQAALPFVDDHLPVHNLASLQDLADRLNRLPAHRPARRQQPSVTPTLAPEPAPPPTSTPVRYTGPAPTFRHPPLGRGIAPALHPAG